MTSWKKSSSGFWGRSALVALLILAIPALSSAQNEPLPEITPCEGASNLTQLEYEGARGFWFPRETALCMATRLRVLPLYAERVRLLEGRLVLAQERQVIQERLTASALEGEEQAAGALETSVGLTRAAEEALNVWYRNPALWFVVGALVVVVLEVVAVWAFTQVVP